MIDNLNSRHMDYIQSEYHIRHPRLIEERSLLLTDERSQTNTMAKPFLEAPPKYDVGKREFSQLNLPDEVKSTLTQFAKHNLEVYNPPYDHQAQAIEAFFSDDKDVIVTTGTGSGKTEIFLYSILGHISQEAERGKTIEKKSVRALVLYPMNALVSDQLTRMRGMFGMRPNPKEDSDFDFKSPQEIMREKLGRPYRFAMYTGRTQYHGKYDPDVRTRLPSGKIKTYIGKNTRRLKPVLEWYKDLEDNQNKLFKELQVLGRVPEKNREEFWNKGKRKDNATGIDPKFRTAPEDAEYLARHEMLDPTNRDSFGGGSPDLLITNYSMLEYMLLRPIEQPILQDTMEWLKADPDNKLLMVMDEAHLYRGSSGAEVGLLLRRLLQRLDVGLDRVKFILTSASFGDDTAEKFASQLTGKDESNWHRQSSEPISYVAEEVEGTQEQMEALQSAPMVPESPAELDEICKAFEWEEPPDGGANPSEQASFYLGSQLLETPLFKYMANRLEYPISISDLSDDLFPNQSKEDAEAATLSLANLACFARKKSDENQSTPLLPTRLHLFFRGLPNQYICANHKCDQIRTESGGFLGRMYLEPHFSCECNHRTFLLETCRDCGSGYFRAYTLKGKFDSFMQDTGGETKIQFWTEPSEEDPTEVHILPLIPDKQTLLQERTFFLDTLTGVAYRNEMDCDFSKNIIRCYIGSEHRSKPRVDWDGFTFNNCPMCGVKISDSTRLRIQDLETKGEQPISNLTANLFKHQPEKKYDSEEESRPFPNRGRKILAFSDSRSKASGLASKIQNEIEQDSFREAIFKIISEQFPWKGGHVEYSDLYAGFVWYCAQRNLRFFQDPRSREPFTKTTSIIQDMISDSKLFGKTLDQGRLDFINQNHTDKIPWDYTASLLKVVGDRYRSIYRLMLGILDVKIDESILEAMELQGIDRKMTRTVILNILKHAAEGRAIDNTLKKDQRDLSRFWSLAAKYPEGIKHNTAKGMPLFHSNLQTALIQLGWTDNQFEELANKLQRPDFSIMDPILQQLDPGVDTLWAAQDESRERFHLNPNRIMIKPALDPKSWIHCNNCLEYNHQELILDAKICPNCSSDDLTPCASDDPHILARTGFYRNSIINHSSDKDAHPLTLRAEEHTAQINNKSPGQVWSNAEKYELEFQDVLISTEAKELGRDQPVDLLSCTTTMEVGIDIGSLTAVTMRTVPPRPDNYQQRAGRSGRRGSSLSTIITFANNSPHEQYIFLNPGKIIDWTDIEDPSLQIDNIRIAERHVNALFIQRYFTVIAPPDPDNESSVFESIGYSFDFFYKKNNSKHSYKEFKKWILGEKNSPVEVERVADLLPKQLRRRIDPDRTNKNWNVEFVVGRIDEFVKRLDELSTEQAKAAEAFYKFKEEEESKPNGKVPKLGPDDTLLNFLLRNGFLPSFSFPLDVARINIFQESTTLTSVDEKFTPSMGLRQALGAYVPGQTLYIDKKKYQSGGLYYPFAPNKENRFEHIEKNDLEHVMLCRKCNALHRFKDGKKAPKTKTYKCQNCTEEDEQHVFPMLIPTDFAPPSKWKESREAKRQQDHLKFRQSSVLLPVSDGFDDSRAVPFGPVSSIITEEDRLFYQLNLGPEDDDTGQCNGWNFCGACGTCLDTLAGNQSGGHERPYPGIAAGPDSFSGSKCGSSETKTIALGYKFKTDMMLIRIKLDEKEIPFECWEENPLADAAQSLNEALIRAITESTIVDVEPSELDGHTRTLYGQGDDENVTVLDFYIFDNTPGGSGHSVRVSENISDIFNDLERILDCEGECDRSCHQCLRTYANRFHQRNLDRHWAASLLQYILSGKIGQINSNRIEKLRDNILIPSLNAALAAEDMDPCESSDLDDKSGIFTISNIDGNDVTFHIRSPFSQENDDADISVSDYDLMRNMPRIVLQIQEFVSQG